MAEFSDKFSATQKSSSIIVNQTYSYINNTGFYALANPVYYGYYYRFARRYAWWYDRFVPDFHNAQQGYFSTGLAHSLVDGIANQIIGVKLLFQNGGEETDKTIANASLKKAYAWANSCDFTTKIRNATKYAGAIGTSLLKANVSGGELWCEALRFDDFFFETDFAGRLQEVNCLIKSYTDTRPSSIKWIDTYGEDVQQCLQGKYYLVERRYFKEITEQINGEIVTHKVPYVIYQVHKYNGNITNAQVWDFNLQESVDTNSLPRNIKKSIGRDYSAIKLGVPLRLPFHEWLGCELFQYNNIDGSLSQQPFGQSILSDIISDLMNYDLAFSYAVRDMYMGKGIVFMAKELQTKTSGVQTFSGLEDSLITLVSSWNDGKLPIDSVQFNLRVAEWREKCNFIYETISMKLNISPSSVASFLSDNSARTAKEVSTETSQTDNYLAIQRGCLEPAINRFLKGVGQFYGWLDTIEIRWAKGGSNNIDTIIDRELKLVQAGLRHPYDALRNIMVDADEWEIEEAWERAKAHSDEQAKIRNESLYGNMDFLNQTSIGGV